MGIFMGWGERRGEDAPPIERLGVSPERRLAAGGALRGGTIRPRESRRSGAPRTFPAQAGSSEGALAGGAPLRWPARSHTNRYYSPSP